MRRVVAVQVPVVAQVRCQIVWLILGTGSADRQQGQQSRFDGGGEIKRMHTVRNFLSRWDDGMGPRVSAYEGMKQGRPSCGQTIANRSITVGPRRLSRSSMG